MCKILAIRTKVAKWLLISEEALDAWIMWVVLASLIILFKSCSGN